MAVGSLNTNKSWSETLKDLHETFRKWDVEDFILPTKQEAKDRRCVVLRFALHGQWTELRCSKYGPLDYRWLERNLRAIYLAVDNVRLMDQRGLGALLAQAAAPLALPSGAVDPHRELGLDPTSGQVTDEDIRRAYHRAAKQAHPDAPNGDPERWHRLQEAVRQLGVSV